MLRRDLNEFFKRIAPGIGTLVRQSCDQIKTDITDACSAQNGDGEVNIRAAMHTACGLQFGIGKRLDAKAHAIDSSLSPGLSLFCDHCFGIGF